MFQVTKRRPRARHSRAVETMRIWLGRSREKLLSLLLTIQILILFVMPAAERRACRCRISSSMGSLHTCRAGARTGPEPGRHGDDGPLRGADYRGICLAT